LPKISIVIPVFNSQRHLPECLDSVVGQTLEDIEVVCVDDNSDDGSPAILRDYAQRDPRVRVILFEENMTASQARKDGVLASTGEYIMFLDADDALELHACERLYALEQEAPVDILHFGTAITTETDLPDERVGWMKGFVKPYDGFLEGSSILEGGFSRKRLYNFTLWDKLYSADLCKRSFSRIKSGRFPRAEDKYAYFILSFYAQTYRGVPDEQLYHYHFGRGATGHNLLSLPAFEKYCSMALVADALKDFLAEEDALVQFEAPYRNARNDLLQDCVSNWIWCLGVEDRAAGFEMMLASWDPSEVFAKITELTRGDRDEIARLLGESRSKPSPKISIIIPVHNVADHLGGCLDSIVEQTMKDIEVICIDDNSSDGSGALLQSYADRDPRIRVLTFSENRSASQARKDGVFVSAGEYIMFVDADDAIERDACERLYALEQEGPVDILHFGTTITTETNLPDERVGWMKAFVKPYKGVLEGSSILEGGFSKTRLYNFTLWDKLYSAELCKKSFARIKPGRFPKAQDKYAYFVLAYYAETYRGVPEQVLYHYHFGRGGTGHELLSFPQFERYCSMALVADAIRDFLDQEGARSTYGHLYRNVRGELLQDCVANWSRHLGVAEKAAGYDLMLSYWDSSEVVAKVAELNWGDQGHIARLLRESQALAHKPRGVRVIGTYYHRYANGGVQRVLSILIRLWVDMGYKVVLLTDLPPSPDDYELPEGVQRVVLTSSLDIKAKAYGSRARDLDRAIREHGIDVVVYHAWVSPVLVWDLLLCKSAGVAFITHCHSVFSQPLRGVRKYFADMPAVYHLCDAVIALSEVDRAYWGNFNDNVACVVNPLTFDLDDLQTSTLEGKQVLWLGRMSDEKRPHEALRIFAAVLEEEPDATLHMVGSSPQQEYTDGLNALIAELGLQDSVVMHGFQKDVLPFYATASLLLMTSEFEGFPTILSEKIGRAHV
jgi:glycosyltransferase involved in cell wall biosynthesis